MILFAKIILFIAAAAAAATHASTINPMRIQFAIQLIRSAKVWAK